MKIKTSKPAVTLLLFYSLSTCSSRAEIKILLVFYFQVLGCWRQQVSNSQHKEHEADAPIARLTFYKFRLLAIPLRGVPTLVGCEQIYFRDEAMTAIMTGVFIALNRFEIRLF